MSRIGRMPIAIPAGVSVKVAGQSVVVEKGKVSLSNPLPPGVTCSVASGTVTFARANDERRLRSLHGLTRALVANAVKGVHEGFTRELDIVGIGYKAQVQGRVLQLALGYSHPVEYPMPDGIEIKVDKQTRLTVTGANRQQVGQVAAEIRGLRPPEPYKGKGIKYVDEVIKKKAGKAGKTGAGAGAGAGG
ncbi:MAG TPA: 50S ribosomal protein L6 [Candidatus Polarisedimenticolia bacterium]|nr:50S ribosomal protein L6 [Candidatus Polarisedimenticolia bacterium]